MKYDDIVSPDNFADAFLALKTKYLESGRFGSVFGIDGMTLSEFSRDASRNLSSLLREVEQGSELLPLLEVEIRKKSGSGTRKVYHSTVRDRILYQAIYQKLQPLVEDALSPFVFSYRKTRSHYHALKIVRRIFMSEDKRSRFFILKTDLKDYTDHLNHEFLYARSRDIGCDEGVVDLLRRILAQPVLMPEGLVRHDRGVVQGIPICSLAANLYLADVDAEVPRRFGVHYQRVGDDIIALSEDREALERTLDWMRVEFTDRSLVINEDKTLLQPMTELFDYLGFEFRHGHLRVGPPKERAIRKWYASRLHRRTFKPRTSLGRRTRVIRRRLEAGEVPQTLNWLRYYHLATDPEQFAAMDRFVRARIAMALTGRNKDKDRHAPRVIRAIRECHVPFLEQYNEVIHGRRTFNELQKRSRRP